MNGKPALAHILDPISDRAYRSIYTSMGKEKDKKYIKYKERKKSGPMEDKRGKQCAII